MKTATKKISIKLFVRRLRGESGLTLVEILASMAIFLVVSTGVAGSFVIGFRSTSDAQLATMGKAVAQQQFEGLKAQPFYVPYTEDAESGTTADIDMLDNYYPNTDESGYEGMPGWQGWYTEGGGDAYYTTVSPADDRGMVTTVETRFIDNNGDVIVPSATYDSDISGSDYPPSYLVEVTLTTTWPERDGEGSYTLVSRVSGTDQTIDESEQPGGGDECDDESDDHGDDDSGDVEHDDDSGDDHSDDESCDVGSDDDHDDGSGDDEHDDGSGDDEHDDGSGDDDHHSDDHGHGHDD